MNFHISLSSISDSMAKFGNILHVGSNEKLSLCEKYLKDPKKCSDCNNLHLCQSYLLGEKCPKFDLEGFCEHAHSLFTNHNLKVLKRKKIDPHSPNVLSDLRKLMDLSPNAKVNPKDQAAVAGKDKDHFDFVFVLGGAVGHAQFMYSFGPGRHLLSNKFNIKIAPSGYSRIDWDKKKRIVGALKDELQNIQEYHLTFEDPLDQMIIQSSAGQSLLESYEDRFAFWPHRKEIEIKIQVTKRDSEKSEDSSRAEEASKAGTDDKSSRNKPRITVEVKDITEIDVEMIVCVINSDGLFRSVRKKAGQEIEDQFGQNRIKYFPFLTAGGGIRAKKILFTKWLEPAHSELHQYRTEAIGSLLSEALLFADRNKIRSIAFPVIGTGGFELNPKRVCEELLRIACLTTRYTSPDLAFVIHPSDPILRTVSDNFMRQIQEQIHHPRSSDMHNMSLSSIRRVIPGLTMTVISDKFIPELWKNNLKPRLDSLKFKMTININDLNQEMRKTSDYLIDQCLKYLVEPEIDEKNNRLILSGDEDSCRKCAAHLCWGKRKTHSYRLCQTSEKPKALSASYALKLDEILCCESDPDRLKISLDQELEVDLRKMEFRLNRKSGKVEKCELTTDFSKMSGEIGTFLLKELHCHSESWFVKFIEKMPKSYWEISEIKSIENIFVMVHLDKSTQTSKAFGFHSCPEHLCESIIHYGFPDNPSKIMKLTDDPFISHVQGARPSSDGCYFMFVVFFGEEIKTKSNGIVNRENGHFAHPKYLIKYRHKRW